MANAIPSAPSLKPVEEIRSKIVEKNVYKDLTEALDAADLGNWTIVRNIQKKTTDLTVSDLLLWKLTTNSSANPTFDELELALERLSDWPKTIEMKKQAESILSYSGFSDTQLSAWFKLHPPVTGTGKLTYARLLKRKSNSKQALATIKNIWWHHSLSRSDERQILLEFGKDLTQEDHSKRVDMLLWGNQRSSAKNLINRLSSSEKKLIQARIGLMEGLRGVDSLINAVPKNNQSDPGLLYERARWRRKRLNNYDGAIEAILEIDPFLTSITGREKIWYERRLLLRTLIKEKRWDEAYKMAAHHGLAEGTGFAEAEFNAGWVALKYLNKPEVAYEHFDTLSKGVGSPISLARGLFWRGEALTAQNKTTEAIQSYEQAAHYNFVFYGQMAAQRLKDAGKSDAQLTLALPEPATTEQRTLFESKPVIKAAMLMAESGRLQSFERFSFFVDDTLTTPQEHEMLSDLAVHYLEPRAGIRNGKAGLANGHIAPNAAFPVISLPDSPGSGIAEPALVMALSRQESELTPTAISHANARGMMQLLPATGRQTARSIGLPFRQSWLTDDPIYNLKVGRSYLDDLIEDFNGSYILALAAYNAGPSRPKRWIEEYGDPRKDEIDPIDFIESIPFSETRNYVQRILENTQVYRHRLSGNPTDISLINDLARGGIAN